jgi:TetR/AcrR family transcriptional regulator
MTTSPFNGTGNLARNSGRETPRSGIRARILEAAVAEFAAKGFQEASLASMARTVGVTAPLVLYHFGSKANLWRDAVEVACAGFASVVDTAVEDGRGLDGRSAFRLMLRRLVHFVATSRGTHRLLRDQATGAREYGEWLAAQQLGPILARIESVYRRAVTEGGVRPAPFETTLFMILGAASGYLEARGFVANLYGGESDNPEWIHAYADQVVGLCFDGLRLEPAPRSSNSDNGTGIAGMDSMASLMVAHA